MKLTILYLQELVTNRLYCCRLSVIMEERKLIESCSSDEEEAEGFTTGMCIDKWHLSISLFHQTSPMLLWENFKNFDINWEQKSSIQC